MTAGWIRLTPSELAQLHALSASNATNNFLAARIDTAGDSWLLADCLDESGRLFSHYAPLLIALAVTQSAPPQWPEMET